MPMIHQPRFNLPKRKRVVTVGVGMDFATIEIAILAALPQGVIEIYENLSNSRRSKQGVKRIGTGILAISMSL